MWDRVADPVRPSKARLEVAYRQGKGVMLSLRSILREADTQFARVGADLRKSLRD